MIKSQCRNMLVIWIYDRVVPALCNVKLKIPINTIW